MLLFHLKWLLKQSFDIEERNLTQEELGKIIGVQKSQISKLESSANSATIDTIIKVFKALKAEINFNVKLEDNYIKLA